MWEEFDAILPGDYITVISGLEWVCKRHFIGWTDGMSLCIGKQLRVADVSDEQGVIAVVHEGNSWTLPFEAIASSYRQQGRKKKRTVFNNEASERSYYTSTLSDFEKSVCEYDVLELAPNAAEQVCMQFGNTIKDDPKYNELVTKLNNSLVLMIDFDKENKHLIHVVFSREDKNCYLIPISSVIRWNSRDIIDNYNLFYRTIDDSYLTQAEQWALGSTTRRENVVAELSTILLLDESRESDIRKRVEELYERLSNGFDETCRK